MSEPEKDKMWQMYKPFLKQYMVPQWHLIAAGIIAGVLAAASAGFGLPFMIQYVFPIVFGETEVPAWIKDWVVQMYGAESVDSVVLWGAAGLIPVVMLIRGMATYSNAYLLTKAGMKAICKLREDIFTQFQWLSFSFHDKESDVMCFGLMIQKRQKNF